MSMSGLDKKARPTNADLQDQVAEVHDCLHQLAKTVQTDRHASRNRDQVLEARLAELSARAAATDARVELLVQFFGLRTPKQEGEPVRGRVTLGTIEWWQAVIGIMASVLGTLGAWKYLWPALVAMHHAIMAGH